jgi:hypothetical protein
MQAYNPLASYAPIYHQQQQQQQPWPYQQEFHPWSVHQRQQEQQQQQQQSQRPLLLNLFDLPDQTEDVNENHRWLEDMEQLGNDECRLTTSLIAPSLVGEDYFGAVGTVFTMSATQEIQIISFEFDFILDSTADLSSSSSSSWEVEVYSFVGDYIPFTNQSKVWNRDEWEDRATATAVLSPDGKYAILPVIESHPMVMSAYTLYSFYITFKDPLSTMKIRLSQAVAPMVDNVVTTDDILQIHVGSSMTSYPFPDISTPGSIFHGVVHYQVTQECNATEFLTESEIVLEFAVNEEQQTQDILTILTSAVEDATKAFIILTPDLIRYTKFHDLSLDSVESTFGGKMGKNALCILGTREV